MRLIAELCAGRRSRSSLYDPEYSRALRALYDSIALSGTELRKRMRPGSSDGAFQTTPLVARKLLEECTAAILGRLDPIRLVVAQKGPKAADFRIGDKNPSSLGWSKDILPDFKPKPDGVWSQATLQAGTVRGLLDGHLATYVFESSHPRVLDALGEFYAKRPVLHETVIFIQRFSDGAHLGREIQKRARESYSCLSKGIHFEFFAEAGPRLSEGELRSAVETALVVIAVSALYSHFVDFSARALPLARALARFDNLGQAFPPIAGGNH